MMLPELPSAGHMAIHFQRFMYIMIRIGTALDIQEAKHVPLTVQAASVH